MAIYEIERTDFYMLEVEAKTKEEALKKCETESECLESGTFTESTFNLIEV